MNTSLRRLTLAPLSIGLALALSSFPSAAWAGAPEDAAAPSEEGPTPEGAPAPEAEGAPAPEPDSAPEDDAPAEDVSPEPDVAPDAEDESHPADEYSHPPEEGDEAVRINPLQGSEARPPGETIQVPVDIGDKHSITYTSLLAPRINPLGLEERLWIGYQYRLYDKNKTILNGSNIGIFLRPILSPAIALLGATFQVQPAAVLRLRATYSYVAWFGTFQYMQSYQSPHDDWSEIRQDGQADYQENNYSITGHQVELAALVQARVKSLAIRSETLGVYNHYNLRGDDDVFYAVRYDTMVQGQGWLLTNDTDVLWLQSIKGPRKATLMAGARASTIMPFYTDDVYEEGDEIKNPNGAQFRLGPALGYIFYNRPDRFPRFNRPTLLVMPQWNIKHRYRSGRDVNAAYPTIIIAFAFTGQLWGRN